MRLSQQNAGNRTVLNNSALAYGSLTNHYDTVEKGLFYVNFTNEGLVVNYSFMENHKELIRIECERLKALGYNAKVSGRKYHKIDIAL